jgi:hypothetical protein
VLYPTSAESSSGIKISITGHLVAKETKACIQGMRRLRFEEKVVASVVTKFGRIGLKNSRIWHGQIIWFESSLIRSKLYLTSVQV